MSKKKPEMENESPAAKAESMVEEAAKMAEEAADAPEGLEHPGYAALEEKLTEAEQKAHDNWDQALRAKAELENVRRRAEQDVEKAHKFALEKFANELLPVVDSLERGLTHADSEVDEIKTMHDGMQMTLDLLLKSLEKFKIEQLNPVGEAFNPDHHEAISMAPDDKAASNTVLQVVQKGYLLNGRLIRPALVIVAQ